jgi:hypothetical protein
MKLPMKSAQNVMKKHLLESPGVKYAIHVDTISVGKHVN